jgi:poly(3-hydroxybutyrate) depolymerase
MLLKTLIVGLLALGFGLSASAEDLTDNTDIDITRSWSQQPGGWTYPLSIRMPNDEEPAGGYPVCILLHGNGGNGQGTLNQFAQTLTCHVLVAPTGYASSWNICGENSDAPDVSMVDELITRLQTYDNVDSERIRIVGFSNGSALANSVLIENMNPGLDVVCAVVSQLSEAQHHDGNFHAPGGVTDPGQPNCGYDQVRAPLTNRKYLGVCNVNDGVIPYEGGQSPVGLSFLPAEQAAYMIARLMGYEGEQFEGPGEPLGSDVFVHPYLDGQVVMLRGFAGHGMNPVQEQYLKNFLMDCEVLPEPCPEDFNEDAQIDGADLSLLLGHWGKQVDPPGTGYDLSGDGLVSGPDLSRVLGFWGSCGG